MVQCDTALVKLPQHIGGNHSGKLRKSDIKMFLSKGGNSGIHSCIK